MSESVLYCPVSGRFGSEELPWWSPSDAGPRRAELRPGELLSLLAELGERPGAESPAADAAFAAFTSGADTLLLSRRPFDADDLELITAELLAAAEHPALTGVRRAQVTPAGHVLVVLDHAPVPGPLQETGDVRALFADLSALHDAGLVHGGLNERFVNPQAPAGRRIMGVGLSEAYAAFRRQEGLAIGPLRADPRFASPAELRGEPASPAGDRFALAAVCVTEAQAAGEPTPAMDPIQGINAHLQRAAASEKLRAMAAGVGERAARTTLLQAFRPEREIDPRTVRLVLAGAIALLLLMQLWTMTRPAPRLEVPQGTATASASMRCAGQGLTLVGDECRLASNVGRCGSGTRLDSATQSCVADADLPADLDPRDRSRDRDRDPAERDDRDSARAAAEPGPYIHPVLACEGNSRMIEYKFSFSSSDINFTVGERSTLSRLTSQCAGQASIVYYTSLPGLESRASTIFDEFRSSSQCSGRCRDVMPEQPTAVLYIPYIGAIERPANHYMFFHCCAGGGQ